MQNSQHHSDNQNSLTIPSVEITAELQKMTDIYKALGDLTRMRIILAVSDQAISVNEIAEALDVSQSAISHQLRLLKQLKIVRSERQGKKIYYSLDDKHIVTIIKQTMDHITEEHHG